MEKIPVSWKQGVFEICNTKKPTCDFFSGRCERGSDDLQRAVRRYAKNLRRRGLQSILVQYTGLRIIQNMLFGTMFVEDRLAT